MKCWLYPSNSCPFFFFSFRRKKSIEIDLKMSNLINCQLSLQDGLFYGWYRSLISPRLFFWLYGVTNHPTNILRGPIKEEVLIAHWLTM
jgi:hypothetical protein